MNTDLFTVTFHRDVEWLKLLCYSVQKNASGFRRHVILIPKRDEAICRPVAEQYGAFPFIVDEYGDGNLFQCACKSHANTYTDADRILYLDSDCWLTGPATPDHFMLDGKPLLFFTPYEHINKDLKPGDNYTPWQEGTENAIGQRVDYEYMRRMGQMHHAWLLPKAMEHLERRFNKRAFDYIMECPRTRLGITGSAPGFSEFNYLGAYAHLFHPDKYACLNTITDPIPDTPVNQAWSHKHPRESHKRAEIEASLNINIDEFYK